MTARKQTIKEHVDGVPTGTKSTTRTESLTKKGRSSSSSSSASKLSKPYFNRSTVKNLALRYPDGYWSDEYMERVSHTLQPNHVSVEPLKINVSDAGPILGMAISDDGELLATFCTLGSAKIWDTADYCQIQDLRDRKEEAVDEYYAGQFLKDYQHIVVAGKCKDRSRWSEEDEDNQVLSCPLKIFNLTSGKVVARLEGHIEEVLCIKFVKFKGENYYLTTSQDGYIIKWAMESDCITLKRITKIAEETTNMAFTVSFVPHTGNKYFLAACDEHLVLYDFENATFIQSFQNIYSSYCDCCKFIRFMDTSFMDSDNVLQEPNGLSMSSVEDSDSCLLQDSTCTDNLKETSTDVSSITIPAAHRRKSQGRETDCLSMNANVENEDDNKPAEEANEMDVWSMPKQSQGLYLISRGVELLDAEDHTTASTPNKCKLHRLVLPLNKNDPFQLEDVQIYMHPDYLANSWLMKVTSNGRVLAAPTVNGQVFLFDLKTGKLVHILRGHEDLEIRDVKFHPTRKQLLTCGDDGKVNIYQLE